MARLASIARAGFYPFPSELLPAVATRLDWSGWRTSTPSAPLPFLACDPCAGEGVALLRLLQAGFGPAIAGPEPRVPLALHGYELETVRARRARRLWTEALPDPHQVAITHTDLFRVQIPRELPATAPGAHLQWLNPPYDWDSEYGRLEERFLRWTTPLLAPGLGVLCFVVPGYAVAASAETLAREFEQIVVYRLPEPHYSVFRQVVLLGLRRARPLTYPAQIAQEAARLRALTADDQAAPVLPSTGRDATPVLPDLSMPVAWSAWPEMRVVPCDLAPLRSHLHLWAVGSTVVTPEPARDLPVGLVPYAPVGAYLSLADFCQGTHITAMPPLPTHTAQILASGMVNGQLVQPDDPAAGLPPVVLTGHFHRVADAVDTHINTEGEVTSIKYEEKPKLRIDLLALSTPPAFHTLKEGTKTSGTTDLGQMNAADFLAHYGKGLAAVIQAQFPALHDPANPAHHLPLPALRRPLFDAQLHAVCALLKIAAIREENPQLYGEPGVGKTAQFLQVALALSKEFVGPIRAAIAAQVGRKVRLPQVRNVLVACPPHLLDNWAREIGKVLPGAQVRQITSIRDLHTPPPPHLVTHPLGQGLCFDILSREAAKLGHGWAAHRPGPELGPGAAGTTHRARTGFPTTSRFTFSPLDQARAALFAAARHTPALASHDRLTQHLRTATGNLALRVGSATLGELQQALAGLTPPAEVLRCARCGTVIQEEAETLAASRGRCPHQPSVPTTPLGVMLRDLALALAPFAPGHELLRTFHPLPYLPETADPRPLVGWDVLTRSTTTVTGLITRCLFGSAPATDPPAAPLNLLTALYQQQAAAIAGSDEWYDGLLVYRQALTGLHHRLLGHPQAVRDGVLVPTLTAVRDQMQQTPLDATGRALVAPFVRRLVQLWTPGAERMALAGELAALLDDQPPADAPVLPPAGMPGLLAILAEVYQTRSSSHTTEMQTLLSGIVALAGSLPAAERAAVIPRLVERLYPLTANSRRAQGPGHQVRYACGLLLALLPEAGPRRDLLLKLRPSITLEGPAEGHPWERLDRTLESLGNAVRDLPATIDPTVRADLAAAYPPLPRRGTGSSVPYPEIALDPDTGGLVLARHSVGTPGLAILAVEQLLKAAPFASGPVCNEPLVQAVPVPGYRVALSRYILRHQELRHRYQLLALDEAHEANHAERAQSQAYYRLAMLPGVLTIPMTGTPMNGYASSIFDLWWHLNRRFRQLFGRKERSRFVALYGYRKLLKRLEDGKPRKERTRLRGKQSDAIVAGDVVEVIGEAPGIAPTALLFTLPDSVPLHLSHLEQVLPPREQHRQAVAIDAAVSPHGAEMIKLYTAEMRRLVDEITASLRDKDLAGKLWGFLAQVGLGYPILCPADVGNSLDDHGRPQYQFLYPKSCGRYAGEIFIELPLFPANVRLPHETALLQLVREELKQDRNVIIYLAHTGNPRLAERLIRLLRGVSPAVYLDVQKVSATRRDAWITERVLKPGVRVLLTNPEAVKTGLNNLTPHFTTAIWFEPTQRTDTYRQAGARIRRIGSHPTTPIRDYLISYAGTAQEAAVKLILEKVRVSELFDGFDLDAGLAAAGVQDGEMALALGNATTSIGRALYQHLKENSGLLRAAAFTNAVRLDVATVPVEPEPAAIQPVRSVIVPIRKGDATQLSMF